MAEPTLHLAPCSSYIPKEHFEDTVETSIPAAEYREFTDNDYGDEIRIWACTEGNAGSWRNVDPGDYLLFYWGDYEYRHAAKVIGKEHNLEWGTTAWPDYERQAGGSDSEDPYEYIIVLDEPFEIELESDEIHQMAGHNIFHHGPTSWGSTP